MRIYPKASPAGQKGSSLAETAFTFLVCDHLQTTRIPLAFLIFLHWAKQLYLLSTELRQNRADLPQWGLVEEGQIRPLAFTFKVPVPWVPDEWKLLEDTYFLHNELQVYTSGIGLKKPWLNQAQCNQCLHPPGSFSSSWWQIPPKPQMPESLSLLQALQLYSFTASIWLPLL